MRGAVAHAIERMRPGTVVAIIADTPDVLEQFRPHLARATATDASP